MEWLNIPAFIIGLLFLIKGADVVTQHSSTLARKLGISQFAVGMTLVAVSTSLPEFAVCIASAVLGVGDIATGTIVGSNIANIGLILGLSALVIPIHNSREFLQKGYLMLVLTLLLSLFLVRGMHWHGGAAILAVVGVYIYRFLWTRTKTKLTRKPGRVPWREIAKHILVCILGAILIVTGADMLVFSTVNIAEWLSIPELVISMTAVAIGTSLPELATSFMAAIKRMEGISVGNVIGSNIFNVTILAVTSFIKPIPTTQHVILIDVPIMIVLTALLLIFMRTGWLLSKSEGFILFLVYLAFLFLQIPAGV
ncbi:MAG TPA: calcium/sodium antiporter [Candidatus Aenigmarchaeota archaeon]|nr:calcium/sodium antiporter [Candidatus Aenigmarchaeota archaeon]